LTPVRVSSEGKLRSKLPLAAPASAVSMTTEPAAAPVSAGVALVELRV
jgi:hypothetical protein